MQVRHRHRSPRYPERNQAGGRPRRADIKIHCPNCGGLVPAENIDLSQKLAKCSRCDSVFSFAQDLPEGGRAERLEVGLPASIQVNRDYTGVLTITRRWFSPVHVFLVFFCLFWNGFMLFWFFTAVTEGQWFMAAFGTLHGLVGVFLTYYTIAGFVNRTVIRVDRTSLTVRHTPLPFWGRRNMAASDLKQLYTKERVNRSSKGGTSYSYELHALTRQGRSVKVLSGLSESEQALYIEQELEKYLRLEDRPVKGEYRAG